MLYKVRSLVRQLRDYLTILDAVRLHALNMRSLELHRVPVHGVLPHGQGALQHCHLSSRNDRSTSQ
jgi:hypothetical protein